MNAHPNREEGHGWRVTRPTDRGQQPVIDHHLLLAQQLAGIGTWEWDIVDDRISWCDRVLDLWGMERADFTGDLEDIAARIHPDDRTPWRESVRRCLEDGEPHQIEFRVLLPDGSIRWIAAMGDAERDEEGRPVRMMGVAVDISQRMRNQEQRQVLEERIRHMEKMNAIGELAGGIAHDFNNQLAGILGFADLLERRLADDPLHEYVCKLREAAERATGLARQLLTFSRKERPTRRTVDLGRIIAETVDIMSHSLDRSITINCAVDADQASCLGDPSELQNAILNIALNARDAMPDGGDLDIRCVRCALPADDPLVLSFDLSPGAYLHLSISDSGTGMSQEVRDRIFEPFFTTKEAGTGTGMGLASVFGCIRAHDGAITVDSHPGQGSTFHIYLPASTASLQSEEQPAQSIIHSRAHVLVIDDEQGVREMSQEMLEQLGCTVTCCEDGQAGLETYQQIGADVDLVLLDVVMPRLSARLTFEAIRRLDPTQMIVICTGSDLRGDTRQLLDDADGFLPKPFTLAQMSAMIEQCGLAS